MKKSVMKLWILALILIPLSPVNAGTDLHWKRQTHPLNITIYDQTANPTWNKALHKLAIEWNEGTEGVEFIFSLEQANCETGHGLYTVVVCIHENRAENHTAEAALYSDGEHLTQVLIWMDPRSNPAYDHLACHELGHALGIIQHRDSGAQSCMTDGDANRFRHPDSQDFYGVSSTYSHIH